MEEKDKQELDKEKIIDANPTKDFFISMLTRDIDLKPAIAELVDNSLDGARRFRSKTNEQCSISIIYDKERFEIIDTCGGMSIKAAKEYCFRFGRPSDEEENDGIKTIGVFGIGMKRALFRLGREFYIKSVTPTEHFIIKVDVDEWIKDKSSDWSFTFDEMNSEETNELNICGTSIIVSKLYPAISNWFTNPYFEADFMEYLRRRSSTLKELNVSLAVNKNNVEYADEKILYDDNFCPKIKIIEIDNVHIKVMAACAKMGQLRKSGWYVFCNGRMVLYANRDETTGWGTDSVPLHHASHAAFRGYVFFESEDMEKLPWNTTKTGVDTSSKYYRVALKEMIGATKEFIEFRKKIDTVIDAEAGITAESIFDYNEVSIFDARIIRLLETDHKYVFPTTFPIPEKPKTSVSFKVEKEKAERVKNYLGVRNNVTMGEKIFNYYYEREIEEDE